MTSARPPLLERMGIETFRRLSRGATLPSAVDAVHVLNAEERAAVRAVERRCIAVSAIAGALSSIAAAAAEVAVASAPPVTFWLVTGGVTAVASIVEIAFLYWAGLRAVHGLAVAAGLELFPPEDERAAVATALARAALELPNPAVDVFGVHPHREASKLGLLVASLAYKAKVSVTNLVVKALVRRALGRALVRTWLPFVAVPVTAAWNGVVAWAVLREARIRAMGPSAVREMLDVVIPEGALRTPAARLTAVSAVASAIVRTRDAHPNLIALMEDVVRRAGPPGDAPIDRSALLLERLPALAPDEQRACLRLLTVATVVDGRLDAGERRLLVEAARACGRTPDVAAARRLRRAFTSGDPVPPEVLLATA